MLAPVPCSETRAAKKPRLFLDHEEKKPELRALVSVNFRGDLPSDPNDFVLWLTSLCPVEVSGVQLQTIEVEACFESNSTLTLISMPLKIWASFQETPACSLIGFVKSQNQLSKLSNHPQEVTFLLLDR